MTNDKPIEDLLSELKKPIENLQSDLKKANKRRSELEAALEKSDEKVAVLEAALKESKQAEKRLLIIQQHLSKAQRISHVGSWVWDAKTTKTIWSDEMYRVFGLTPGSPEQIVPDTFMSRVHPDDREMVLTTGETMVLKKVPYEQEFRTVPINDVVRTIRGSVNIDKDEQGEILRVFGTSQDITKLKETEEALRESQKRLSRAQHIAHVGSWVWNVKTKKIVWSSEMYRLFGLTPGDPKVIRPDTFMSRVHPDDREIVMSMGETMALKKQSYEQEFRTIPIDGVVRTLRGTVNIDIDKDGEVVRVFGISQDITKLKESEATQA